MKFPALPSSSPRPASSQRPAGSQRPLGSLRRQSLVLVAVAALALLAACGGNGEATGSAESGDRETTTTTTRPTTTVDDGADEAVRRIAAGIVSQMGTNQDDAECAARVVVDELGVDRAVEVDSSAAAFSTLTQSEQVVMTEAFDSCIPGSAIAEQVVSEFYGSVGTTLTPDASVIECASSELDGRVGTIAFEGLNADGPDPDLTNTIAVLSACIPDEVLVDSLANSLQESGATRAQAMCTAERLIPDLSLDTMMSLGEELTPELQQKVTDAADACRSAS